MFFALERTKNKILILFLRWVRVNDYLIIIAGYKNLPDNKIAGLKIKDRIF